MLVFGAPAALVAMVLCVVGIVAHRFRLLVLGGIVFLPPVAYLAAGEGFAWVGLVSILPFIAAYMVSRSRALAAWAILLPNLVVAVLLCVMTVSNLSRTGWPD
jgi:hypothetical protein